MNQSGLYCPKCGQLNAAEARFCRSCGAAQPPSAEAPGADAAGPAPAALRPEIGWQRPAPQPSAVPGSAEAVPGQPAAARAPHYAGFWIRVVAILIDGAVLSIPAWLLWGVVFAGLFHAGVFHPDMSPDPERMMMTMLPAMGGVWLIALVGSWLYDALLTSSRTQGTLGKMALGLKVTDRDRRRISFARATGRHFAKYISSLTFCIGYLIAGFTARKQALHDFIAGTCVVRSGY
jgi:uncharacterized RDD family membrane protein YckC